MTDCYLTFDIEDWFHAHNLRPQVSRVDWTECESRVKRNVQKILELLDKYDTKATFFILGWVADRIPAIVKTIADAGHEVASHGYNHELLYEQSIGELRTDFQRSLKVLEPHLDGSVKGYRAPSFSITNEAINLLDELGFEYDSSSFGTSFHDRYGNLSERRSTDVASQERGLVEIQLPGLTVHRFVLPWAGGGYFRFIPYPVFRRGVERITANRDFVFYLHPWELDPGQPRCQDLPLSNRVRHYTNLDATERKLERLLSDFDWKPLTCALD